MPTDRWRAVDCWVVEECPEQPDEPQPLFQCDTARNAATVARIFGELAAERDALAAEVERLRSGNDLAGNLRVETGLRIKVVELQRERDTWRGRAEAHRKALAIAAAVITRVRELAGEWRQLGADRGDTSMIAVARSIAALLGSPNTEEQTP